MSAKRKERRFLILWGLSVCVLFFCGMSKINMSKEDKARYKLKKQALEIIDEMEYSFKHKDVSGVLQFVSERVAPVNKTELQTQLINRFKNADHIQLNIVSDAVLIHDDLAGVTVQTHWQKSFLPKGSITVLKQEGKTEFVFENDGDLKLSQLKNGSVFS